jgi:hypothetical protein
VVGKKKVGGRSLVGRWWDRSSHAYASSRSHIGPPGSGVAFENHIRLPEEHKQL